MGLKEFRIIHFSIKEYKALIKTKLEDIKLICKLVKNDLKARYSGSALGLVWAYVQPLVTVLVFWYVFQVGFRNPPVSDVEYILWFIAGFIPWTFFNDGILSSANVFYEYSYLVKKMKFKVWQLPIVKVMSSFCIHFFLLVFVVGMYLLYGHQPKLAWVSILYYSGCIMFLLIGNAFLVGALSVFFKDAVQMVGIILQIGFWLTPVFWSDESMSENILRILSLNPLHYVLQGYRDALIRGIPFWEEPIGQIAYFWIIAIIINIIGLSIYKKLRVHFSDLL